MNSIETLKNIAECISAQFGNNTEVVIHDFRNGFDKTIVHIENGHVTGREMGGCPTTLFLEELKRNEHVEKNFRYITHTPDGKTLRSSTVNFYEDKKLTGSICINQDITDMIALERVFNNMSKNNYFEKSNEKNEMFSSSISEMLESFIAEGISQVGVPVTDMNKESKMKFLRFLDHKGVFLIQKSGLRICELLGISKFTLYNYLDEIRK
ncbi:transcriptional regulator [Acidaminobacter sp. JC074]|uniref:helix-turn-helix transcriptional regulator n=1 Tax=Acidaminobacter sp. JC074 TaxID=2530199 RepID=UPI001F0E152F|nr:helix-turn-helix transcriptional regulator [Acidaminobacter sp. JC074]MCH4886063.1 transcriptional regulator [Acidaminobacter sp. JC074]